MHLVKCALNNHQKLILCTKQNRILPKIAIGQPTQRTLATTTTHAENAIESPKKTTLYDLHVQHKGKFVDFAGYLLPVQYSNFSISASHLHTRQYASIFDVSHMLQTYVRGKDAVECFESICTADIKGLANNSGTLTVFTNSNGGIFDDLIVTKVTNDLLYVVSNAACRHQDMNIMQECVVSGMRILYLLLLLPGLENYCEFLQSNCMLGKLS